MQDTGHFILGCNYKTPYAEVDFLTIKDGIFYLLEVKSSAHLSLNSNIVTQKQLRRLKNAGQFIIVKGGHPLEFHLLIVDEQGLTNWLPIN